MHQMMQDFQVMNFAICKVNKLKEFSEEVVFQMFKLFRINVTTPQRLVQQRQLNRVIGTVLLLERQLYKDYLGLPKFKKIRKETNQAIESLFIAIWKAFLNEKEHKNQTLLSGLNYMNQFGKPLFMQNYQNQPYSLGMYQMFSPNYQIMHTPTTDFIQTYNNMNYAQPQIFQGYPFSSQPLYPNPNQNLVSNNYRQDQICELPAQGEQIVKEEHKAPRKMQKRKFIRKQYRKQKQQIHLSDHIVQKNKAENIILENPVPNLINLSFLRCKCEGLGHQIQSEYFECIHCKFAYHFKCLNLSRKRDVCPYCFLTLPRVFNKLSKKPIKFGWFVKQKGGINIKFSQDEVIVLRKMFQKKSQKQQIQFRILNISDQVRKQHDKKLNWVIVLKGHSIDIMQKTKALCIQPLNQNSDTQQLIFYTISCVQDLKHDEIIDQLVNTKTPTNDIEYIKDRMNELTEEQKEIPLIDDGDMPIQYPVRGSHCKHIQVFDLRSLLQSNTFREFSDIEIHCPFSFCKEKCDLFNPFKIDKFIFTEMNKLANSMDESEPSKPTSVLINKSGIITWNFQDDSKTIQMNINQIKSMSEEKDKKAGSFPSKQQMENQKKKIDVPQAEMMQ